MKRILLILGFVSVLSFVISININLNKSEKTENLSLGNVEALAAGEISMIFCVDYPKICVLFDDGYFVLGYPQYVF